MTASELRAIIKDLPPIEGADIWANHRRSLREHILEEEASSFLGWSTISATMQVGNAPYIPVEYSRLNLERYKEAIRFTTFTTDLFQGYSSNLIHQAYHLSQWERVTGQRVENLNRIIEFGGGYGAMCLICQRLGFKGSYWIEDFPELSALQAFYLSNTARTEQIHYALPYNYECNLFIASHSLSEVSLEERERVLRGLRADSFLFVFHCEHNGIDNLEWFGRLAKDRPEYEWSSWYTEHLLNQWYQIGIRKDG